MHVIVVRIYESDLVKLLLFLFFCFIFGEKNSTFLKVKNYVASVIFRPIGLNQ